ncbi:hypothetical protein RNJ44_04786 [Nakaseomyces bracarensis]|uniref:Uncharacterized protein n=1 Tax=Nakaseomyces bracarensis TaxID=273131 RepID=A0ABR4NVV5_9SACH
MTEKYKISTGRGGAGNIHASDSRASPKMVKQGSQTPSILQPVYSTGRGGAGNMRRNTDPKLTRRAQDVDANDSDNSEGYVDELMDGDDYIGPIHDTINEENSITNGGDDETAVDHKNHSNGGRKHHRVAGGNSRSRSRSRSKSRLSRTLSAQKSHGKPKMQEKFIIGRGGAGNIISPKTSNTARVTSSRDNNKKEEDEKKKKKKKGLFASISNMFSSS